MIDNQRFREVFAYLRDNKYVRNQQDFTERIGSDKSTVSQILRDLLSVPNHLFGRVSSAFPFINDEWLRSGEGAMLKPSVQQTSSGAYSPNVYGNENNVNGVADFDRFLDELSAQRRLVERTLDLLEKRDTQLDRLISLLENQK